MDGGVQVTQATTKPVVAGPAAKRPLSISLLFLLRRLLGWVTLALIIVLLGPKLLAYADNYKSFPLSTGLLEARDSVMRVAAPVLRRAMPTVIAGADRTEWILCGLSLLLTMIVGGIAERMQIASNRRRMQKAALAYQNAEVTKTATANLKAQVTTAEIAKSGDRHELLKVFAETKKKLDSFGREVAFLAIDVVGSTAMKVGEDPASVQYDFQEYRKMVENVFRARGVLKSAWTPDGVMACFAHVDDAVNAGQDVIRNLKVFNRDHKLTSRDFEVRCGVNAGTVYFDDTTPLESISDRVIDIAGHMQKYAEPNTVAVARRVIEPLRTRNDFTHTTQVVDGYEVSAWRLEQDEAP